MKTKLLLFFLLFVINHSFTRIQAQRLEAAQLTLQKDLNGETLQTTKVFPVDKKLGSLMIEITGKVSSGKINMMLSAPNEKNYSYDIDVTTNMEFSRTINLKKQPEYTGDWKIFISSDNAVGSYCLVMRTTTM